MLSALGPIRRMQLPATKHTAGIVGEGISPSSYFVGGNKKSVGNTQNL